MEQNPIRLPRSEQRRNLHEGIPCPFVTWSSMLGGPYSMPTMKGHVTCGNKESFSWHISTADHFFKDSRSIHAYSPSFSYKGCSWNIEMFRFRQGALSAFLARGDDGPISIRVSYAWGFEWKDGSFVVESPNLNQTFLKSSPGGSHYFLPIREPFYMGESSMLTITCRFQEEDCDQWDLSSPNKFAGLKSLSSDFGELLSSGYKSDVVLKVQGKKFFVHRVMLGARSPVFRAAFSHDSEEEKTGVVTIQDCDPESFSHFLSFLYSGRVSALTVDTAQQLYVTSDKYDVQTLKSICCDYLKQNLTPESVCDVAVLADRHFDDGLMRAAQLYFNQNYCSILLTSEWTATLKRNPRVSDKLLKEMASENKKKLKT